tara:strand:- start:650 stop:889 length:240 start_codon:yes stop_codon:yes gene_type:complete
MISGMGGSMAEGAMSVFNPTKSVIVDMIMIQLIAMTLTLLAVLVFNGEDIKSGDMAWMVGGLFGSFLLASAIYSRITSI